ncbi:hypothetical protein Tco_1406696 [Tanacetum coccineum]
MNNIWSMRMANIVNALQQGASDNTREGFQLIFKEFLSRRVVVSQLCCLDTKLREIDSSIMKATEGCFYHQFRRPLHGGGRGFMLLLYDNQYGPPCGPMASMSNVSHVFVSASFQPFSHQFRTPHGGDGPRFMRNVFHMLRAEATSFQPLAGHEEQVEAAAPLDDFPPPEEQVEAAAPLDDFPPLNISNQ